MFGFFEDLLTLKGLLCAGALAIAALAAWFGARTGYSLGKLESGWKARSVTARGAFGTTMTTMLGLSASFGVMILLESASHSSGKASGGLMMIVALVMFLVVASAAGLALSFLTACGAALGAALGFGVGPRVCAGLSSLGALSSFVTLAACLEWYR